MKADDAIAPRGSAPLATWLYYIGLLVDTGVLLMMAGNAAVMPGAVGTNSYPDDPVAGLTAVGWYALWAMPLALVALMGTAWALKARGAVVFAVVLLWIPAVPFALALLVGLGLAILLIVFGNR